MTNFDELRKECLRLETRLETPASFDLPVELLLHEVSCPFLSPDRTEVWWEPLWEMVDLDPPFGWIGYVQFDDSFRTTGPATDVLVRAMSLPDGLDELEAVTEMQLRVQRDYSAWMRRKHLDDALLHASYIEMVADERERLCGIALAVWSLPDGPDRYEGLLLSSNQLWPGTGDDLVRVVNSPGFTRDRLKQALRAFQPGTEVDGSSHAVPSLWLLTFDELVDLASLTDTEMEIASVLVDRWSGSAAELIETVKVAAIGPGSDLDVPPSLQLAPTPPPRWNVTRRQPGQPRQPQESDDPPF